MAEFTIHTTQSAPEAARSTLENAEKTLGFVPSLYGVFADNPAVLDAYLALGKFFDQAGFSKLEQQVVFMTANVENECHFCVAAHTAISKMQKLPDDVINAIRDGEPIADAKLEALRVLTRKVVVERVFVSDADVDAFLNAGYTRTNVLGVILSVSMKVLSNYTNHVAETPVNEAFQPFAWTPPQRVAAE